MTFRGFFVFFFCFFCLFVSFFFFFFLTAFFRILILVSTSKQQVSLERRELFSKLNLFVAIHLVSILLMLHIQFTCFI